MTIGPSGHSAPAVTPAAGAGACDICGAPVRAITWRAAVGDISRREWEAGRLLYCAGCFALVPGVE